MEQEIKGYYSGTSGLLLPVPNKSHYPEAFREKPRLSYYASLMNSIEINSSFYKVPLSSTVKKWYTEVPEDFRFTFKLFREITHAPQLDFDPAAIRKFMAVIANADDKKGCLLVQFPPSIKIANLSGLARLMYSLRECDPDQEWKIALEFRHPSLYVDEIMELLEEQALGMVIQDKGTAASPLDGVNPGFCYLRFHGPDGNCRGTYREDVLAEYASYLTEWLREGKQVYVYFNNTMGEAYDNLNTLKRFVAEQL